MGRGMADHSEGVTSLRSELPHVLSGRQSATSGQSERSYISGRVSTVQQDAVIADAEIVDGMFPRFKDQELEREFHNMKKTASRRILLAIWLACNAVLISSLYNNHVGKEWTYSDLPAGAMVIFVAQACVLVICQVPLALWFTPVTPAAFEGVVIVASSTIVALISGPSNFYRVAVVFHGDGCFFNHLFDGTCEFASDMAYVTGYTLITTAILMIPVNRASRTWQMLALDWVMFAVLTLYPGLSPEGIHQTRNCALYLAIFYPSEKLERRAWYQRLQLGIDNQALRDADELQRQSNNSLLKERELMSNLEEAIESEDADAILAARDALRSWKEEWTEEALHEFVVDAREQQSLKRGVRLSYLLSNEFLELAQQYTGARDPTFIDMKKAFFLGPDALGGDLTCPRDGRTGCSLVDTLKPEHRAQSNWFLSWTWAYRLSVVRDALQRWAETGGHDPKEVSFYMCFFVNNQYRILGPQADATGADVLGDTFEANLTRLNRMVALLDTFDRPLYLTRIWTIFEQFVAMKLRIPVWFALPADARTTLIREFEQGKTGILKVQQSLSKIDSSTAEATEPSDKIKVQVKIVESGGFELVDSAVQSVMCKWVGNEVRAYMEGMLRSMSGEPEPPVPLARACSVHRGGSADSS